MGFAQNPIFIILRSPTIAFPKMVLFSVRFSKEFAGENQGMR